MPERDVPSPIDLRRADHAREWARQAMLKRPERALFFEAIAARLAASGAVRVLELGSGPGFLARHLCTALPGLRLTLLDFSPAMHELARERLAEHATHVTFVVASFRDAGWAAALPDFDAVVTVQAVHELRHKRHALALHSEVKRRLRAGGEYLVCDHFVGPGGMQNGELFMTSAEQAAALYRAGFATVEPVLQRGTLTLHVAH